MNLHPAWLDAISNLATYPHPISDVKLLETHISWVILTGEWVYKLKKPVNFGFVDFSTLELRRAACYEELRLNRRTASDIYDSVVELHQQLEGPRFGGDGPLLEYAVRMRQFDQENLLERKLEHHEVSLEMIDALATEIASMHRDADAAAADQSYGEPDAIGSAVRACLDVLDQTDLPEELRQRANNLSSWTEDEWQRLKLKFVSRKQRRRVRECHGDLHLGNLVAIANRPIPFDCLEFNPQLRWIDVISDIAFLVMDLHDREESVLAWRVLNGWLSQTGDYDGLAVLKYYLAYRALVRAKVAALRLSQPDLSEADTARQHELLESYVDLATRLTRKERATLIIMHGVSGSGKSYVARELASTIGAIQIRSDVERKRMAGQWPSIESSDEASTQEAVAYSENANRETYSRLKAIATTVVTAGYHVIVDAAFLRQTDRREFAKLAADLHVPFVIVCCQAPEAVMQERVAKRILAQFDPSDANSDVLRLQLCTAETLDGDELGQCVVIDTSRDEMASCVQQVRERVFDANEGI